MPLLLAGSTSLKLGCVGSALPTRPWEGMRSLGWWICKKRGRRTLHPDIQPVWAGRPPAGVDSPEETPARSRVQKSGPNPELRPCLIQP